MLLYVSTDENIVTIRYMYKKTYSHIQTCNILHTHTYIFIYRYLYIYTHTHTHIPNVQYKGLTLLSLLYITQHFKKIFNANTAINILTHLQNSIIIIIVTLKVYYQYTVIQRQIRDE